MPYRGKKRPLVGHGKPSLPGIKPGARLRAKLRLIWADLCAANVGLLSFADSSAGILRVCLGCIEKFGDSSIVRAENWRFSRQVVFW